MLKIVPVGVLASACGSSTTLDLGHRAPPWYAPPETIAVGDGAPPGMPTVIAAHQRGANDVAVDDTRVYWTTFDWAGPNIPPVCAVHSCLKSGCAGTLITYASTGAMLCESRPTQLAVNRTHVFWLSADDRGREHIQACPIEGCPETGPMTLVRGISLGFAVDETYVYWQSYDATIWRCALENCAEKSTLIAYRDSRFPTGENLLVVDATQLYWADTEGASTSTVIKAVAKDGSGTARKLAATVASYHELDLAVDEKNIYWMESQSEMVVKSCPRTGCSTEPLILASQTMMSDARTTPSFGALVVEGDQLFWSAQLAGAGWPTPEHAASVHACSAAGCGVNSTALVERQTGIGQLAVDASHVYWTSYTSFEANDTLVQRIRRRP